MADLIKDKKGYRIRFYDIHGARQTFRLSGLNKNAASGVKRSVEDLVVSKASGQSMKQETAIWLAKISDALHAKLLRVGLVEPRLSMSVAEFIDSHIAAAKTAKSEAAAKRTVIKWQQAAKLLKEFFRNKNLRDISSDDADRFRAKLDAGHLSEATIRTHISAAKVFFNAAKRKRYVAENPFAHLVSASIANRSRDYFLSRENALKLIEACPDNQWRLMIALWRFAGLRKMEIFHLRWEHILWDKGKMLVTCQKTAHHAGKGSRFVPIGDILPWLSQAFSEAPEGSQKVITRFTPSNENLAKPLVKIIHAAGLTEWPKLIQNLRASCETDWLDSGMPAHVVANWIGHSVKVQTDHYAQVDDHHFQRFNDRTTATGTDANSSNRSTNANLT
jgi:integrase